MLNKWVQLEVHLNNQGKLNKQPKTMAILTLPKLDGQYKILNEISEKRLVIQVDYRE